MIKAKEKSNINGVLNVFPVRLKEEIIRLAEGRQCGIYGIREIRLRSQGLSSMLMENERIPLFYTIGREETERILSSLMGGALYAHRDSVASGYLNFEGGVRVGVCGSAAYEGDRLIGVSNMRSLVFRIPIGRCDFADELYSIFCGGIGHGMLIYSPPGVGKTTALRSLAHSVGSGCNALRVAVVDERCEFLEEDYTDSEVDILRGYRRHEGIEIATRTLSSQLIMIDEIGMDDADALMGAMRCGIPLIATAHAADVDEVLEKPSLREFFKNSVFSLLVGISQVDGEYKLKVDRV